MLLLLLFASCTDEPVRQPVRDSEVVLAVHMDGGSKLRAAMPDPGGSHGEDVPQWETLGVYLAYANGEVLAYSFTRGEYEAHVAGHDDFRHFSFTVSEGDITVYVVAFGAGQAFKPLSRIEDLKKLSIAELTGISDVRTYMQNLFSGKSATFTVKKNEPAHVDVTLHRLAAKIDVQYDVQDAYSSGQYTRAVMSAVTCRGSTVGYFFPDEAGASSGMNMDYSQTCTTAAVSERNGRAYFYVLPGMRNEMEFSVAYTKDGVESVVTYKATFKEALKRDAWHYVQFNVKGNNIDTNQTIELNASPSQ